MVKPVHAQRRMLRAAIAVVVAVGLGVAGCGDDEFANRPRPPVSRTLSAAISHARVTVSPARLSPGTVVLIASNQTATSQRVTLRSSRGTNRGRQLVQTTGPINPGDTASLTADLRPGSYVVTARTPAIDPATIVVAAAPGGGADGLLQP